MNPLLSRLQPYPFERLRQLFASAQPPEGLRPISLGIGEPRHATPAFIEKALSSELQGLSVYPATAGLPALRQACAQWANRRYGVELDAATQVFSQSRPCGESLDRVPWKAKMLDSGLRRNDGIQDPNRRCNRVDQKCFSDA